MKSPLTQVKIKDRTGQLFEGTALECAQRMLPDAYMSSLQLGGMGDMVLADFCKEFGMELVKPPFQEWYISLPTKTNKQTEV